MSGCLIFLSSIPVHAEAPAVLELHVVFQGKSPDFPIPDDAGNKRPLLEVGRKGGLKGVVAWLEPAEGAKREPPAKQENPPKPDEKDQRPALVVDQQGYQFTPHVAAVQAGRLVRFTNSDGANHNVRAASIDPKNQFNVFTNVGGRYDHRFEADPAKVRPVLLGCDIHPWMQAWLFVFDHPRFSVTDPDGRASLSAPAGRYRLFVRQPDAGFSHEQDVTLTDDSPLKLPLTFTADHIRRR